MSLNNKKNSERWELRLGVAQTVMFLGLVLGTVALAFVLGYFSGRTAGIRLAMDRSASREAKIPITSETPAKESENISEKVVDEVYDKLREKAEEPAPAPKADEEMPALGTIKEATSHAAEAVTPVEDSAHPAVPTAEAKTLKEVKEVQEAWDVHETPQPEKVATAVPIAQHKEEPTGVPQAAPQPTTLPEKTKKEVEPLHQAEVKPSPAHTISSALSVDKVKEQDKDKDKEKGKESKSTDGAKVLRGTIPSGWYAQVAAPSSNQDAEALAGQIRSNGFHVVIENAKVKEETYYRILVGPEANRSQAEALVNQLKRESYIKTEPFIRMVR